jgi:hypothetical protein
MGGCRLVGNSDRCLNFGRVGRGRLAAVEAGLSVSPVNLVKLKVHATGKGNALKPEMRAAAKERWGKDLGEE